MSTRSKDCHLPSFPRIKEQGRQFKRIADAHRGKPVVIPDLPPPPPPSERTNEATWKWILDWMGWKKPG